MGICRRGHSVTLINGIPHKINCQSSLLPSPYQAIDLERLENVILQILQNAKESSCSDHHKPFKGKWKLPESSDVARLRSFLSDTGDCAEDLDEILSSDVYEGLNNVVGSVLETLGKVHWVTAGLLAVGLLLSRFKILGESRGVSRSSGRNVQAPYVSQRLRHIRKKAMLQEQRERSTTACH